MAVLRPPPKLWPMPTNTTTTTTTILGFKDVFMMPDLLPKPALEMLRASTLAYS